MWLRSDYLHSVFSKLFLIFCSFLNTVIINRYLGLEMRGEFAYFVNIVNLLSVFISMAVSSSLPYLREKYGEAAIHRVIKLINIQVLIYILFLLIVGLYWGSSFYTYILFAGVLLQYANQLDFIAIVCNIKKRNRLVGFAALTYLIVLSVVYFYLDASLDAIVFSFMLYAIVRVVFYLISFKFFLQFDRSVSIDFFEIIKVSGFSMLVALVGMLNYNADVIILERYVSFAEIGIYSAAVGLASMFWVVPDAFKDVLIGRMGGERGLRHLIFGIKINIVFSLLVLIIFFFIGRQCLVFFYGADYESSFSVTLILLVGVIPMILFKFINAYYLYLGKQILTFFISLVAVLINIGLNFYLIPEYGVNGSAFSSVVSYMFVGLFLITIFIFEQPKVRGVFLSFSRKEIIDFFK
jgi:O-antigen/teichoic acid export membrane protein